MQGEAAVYASRLRSMTPERAFAKVPSPSVLPSSYRPTRFTVAMLASAAVRQGAAARAEGAGALHGFARKRCGAAALHGSRGGGRR